MDNRITDKKAHPWMKTDHVLMDIGKWQIISTHIWINRINGCMILVMITDVCNSTRLSMILSSNSVYNICVDIWGLVFTATMLTSGD